MDYPLSYLFRFLLEAAAFLVICGVGVRGWREGRWAVLAAIGGGLASLTALVQLEGYVEAKYLNTSHLFEILFVQHEHVVDALAWSRVIGFVLIAVALLEAVRTRVPRLT